MSRPVSIKIVCGVILILFFTSLIDIVTLSEFGIAGDALSASIVAVIGMLLSGVFGYFIWKGKRWARNWYVGILAFSIIVTASMMWLVLPPILSLSAFMMVELTLMFAVPIFIIVLLYLPSTRAWFRPVKLESGNI